MFFNNGECKGRGWGSRGTGGGWGYQGIPISLGGWGNSWSSGGNIGGHWKADLKEGDGIWLPADKYYIPKHTRMYEDDQEVSYIMAKMKEMVGGDYSRNVGKSNGGSGRGKPIRYFQK